MVAHMERNEIRGGGDVMRICVLNMPMEYFSPVSGGAISTVIMESSRELIARGHEVTIMTMVNGDPTYDVGTVAPVAGRTRDDLSFVQRRWSDVRQRIGKWDWPYYEFFRKSYMRRLQELPRAPDVVIVHNDLAAPRFIRNVLPGTKVMTWLHNENRTGPRNILANRTAVDHHITVSGYIRDWTMKHMGVPGEKITAILNAANPETFFPRDGALEPRTPVRVLFASRIDRNKGPDLAADAVATLKSEGLDVTLTIAGGLWWYGHGKEMEDPFFRELKGKMDAAKAEYLGHVTRDFIPELFRAHDIVCLLSRSNDPCPLVCLEALSSGCALLASTRGGIPEVCGGGAILVDPDKSTDVTAALRRLVAEPAELRKWKQAGIERAAQRPWACVAEEVERVCGRLGLETGSRAPAMASS